MIRIGLDLLYLAPGATGGMEVYARALVPRVAAAWPKAQEHVRHTVLLHHADVVAAAHTHSRFGRAWRRGVVDVAIGVAGLTPVLDLRGTQDALGRTLDVTEVKPGPAYAGVDVPTKLMAYDYLVTVGSHVKDDQVYRIAKAMYEGKPKLIQSLGAFRGFNAEEILTIGVDCEDLAEHLATGKRVIDGELDLRWRWQTGADVDIENEFGERCAVFELNGHVRKWCVPGTPDEHGLAAAHSEIAGAGSGGEIDYKARAGAVEVALHE